ncbi:MAG: HAMP domain-containing histidine kinase [Anaerolineae bacterium]|nr:HAMP domain-containing histidine kinase [Anaerolineae bacterium]
MTSESLDFARLVKLTRQMAHDIRSPLGAISATADMFVHGGYGELSPKQDRAAHRIKRASRRSMVLLDDFMTYVKAEAHQLPLDIRPFNPQSLLAKLHNTVLPDAQAKGLNVHLSGLDDLPPLLDGDEALIRRMVLVLLWNAISFSEQGEISLLSQWDAVNAVWTIKVSDEGTGIAPEHVPHIFEPLWRGAESSQSQTSGYGIGLAMAQALARLMNGELTLDKTGPEGSLFCLRLPLQYHLTPNAIPR